jgi:hypothetical protein
MRARSIIGLGAVAAVAMLALTACNPIVNQPTAVRDGGVSRSGLMYFTGDEPGWLEVAVRTSADATVSVEAFGRDETQPYVWNDTTWCYFDTDRAPAWTDGSSLGWQRLIRIGPGAELKLQFSAPTEGTTFDARVVDDAGHVVGDLRHEIPIGGFEAVSGAICPG